MSTVAIQGAQPIAGYVLRERIGSGAYGEVWSAEVPGGLIKAVKIVYGHHNEVRASRELKALERIKQLRHPFLLSLERIEIVDGRLIIVNELADMSLKQRYVDCKEAGAPGIARDELLNYLRDAADALDYLNSSQSLQHLDVKAENLLLVGGRLKVGDFGLVRNLTDSDASMLEGMTPRYAAPEVFEGRPSRFSDQFSLAVVFAELLTGQPPFDAKSAAQFAAQHLLGAKPKLDLLAPVDQAIVARALAKVPQDRFANCRAFVDALVRGAAAGTPANDQGVEPGDVRWSAADGTSASGEPAASESAVRAIVRGHAIIPSTPRVASAPSDDMTLVLGGDSSLRQPHTRASQERSEARLPAADCADLAWAPRPTLLVGLGGVATQVLRGLSQRIARQFAEGKPIPAWKMLAIDTDPTATPIAPPQPGSTEADDLLITRLRSTQEYRTETPAVLNWLSRRWLYNIPREPRTSRCRPLGRLALVDSGERVMQRLRAALREFLAPQALAASAATLGTQLSDRPTIVLVSTLGGGTGSGMVLDLAYAVRKLATELGLKTYDLRGLLLHSTEQDGASHDLAVANAVACLTELAHYNRPGGGYPGEEALQVPAVPSILHTFDETLLAHLGDGLTHTEFQTQLERITDYLYHRVATRAGTLLDKLHAEAEAQQNAATLETPVRTFGLFSANNLPDDVVAGYIDRLCQLVADRWLGTDRRGAATERTAPMAGGDEVLEKIMQLVELSFGPRADRRYVREVAFALAAYIRDSADPSGPTAGGPFRGNSDVVLTNCSMELSSLSASLVKLRDSALSITELQGLTGASSAPETPLYSLHSAVQSFLNERVTELAAPLASEFPATFFQRQRRASDDSAKAGEILQGFARQLRITAEAQVRKALTQIDVTQLLLDMTSKSSSARDPLRHIVSAAQPRLATGGVAERMVVLAPSYADVAALGNYFAEDLQEAATVVSTPDPRLTVCIERERLTIRDIAATLVDGQPKYLELASRLQTRVDVPWSSLRLG